MNRLARSPADVAANARPWRRAGNSHAGGVLRAQMTHVRTQSLGSAHHALAGLNPATGVFTPTQQLADQSAPFQTQSFSAEYGNRLHRTAARSFLKAVRPRPAEPVDAGIFACGVPANAGQTAWRSG